MPPAFRTREKGTACINLPDSLRGDLPSEKQFAQDKDHACSTPHIHHNVAPFIEHGWGSIRVRSEEYIDIRSDANPLQRASRAAGAQPQRPLCFGIVRPTFAVCSYYGQLKTSILIQGIPDAHAELPRRANRRTSCNAVPAAMCSAQ